MTQIRITNISGETLPIEVYISDILGNNNHFIGTINSTVPPTIVYNSIIPSIFNTAPEIKLTLIDSNNCQISKILDCVFGCAFNILFELESCVVDMTISVQ
jgi:hypothetical protein